MMTVPERWQYDAVHEAISKLIQDDARPVWIAESLCRGLTAIATVQDSMESINTSVEPLFSTALIPPTQAATWPIQPLSAVLAYNIANTILNQQLPLPPQAQAELSELQAEPLNADGESIQTQVTAAVSCFICTLLPCQLIYHSSLPRLMVFVRFHSNFETLVYKDVLY
jgi:hypothetical protein